MEPQPRGRRKASPHCSFRRDEGKCVRPKSCYKEAPGAFPGAWGARAWHSGGQLSEGGFGGAAELCNLAEERSGRCPETAGQLMVQDLVAGALVGRWA